MTENSNVNTTQACNLCNNPLNDTNTSEEHILLNAIGGRLKSKYIWCRKCNGKFGEKCDAVLADQLNSLANLLNIDRDRGTPQPITATTHDGETIGIHPGGKPFLTKPTYTENIEHGVGTIQITAPNTKIAKQMLMRAKKRYPSLDLDALQNNLRTKATFIDEPVNIHSTVGGDIAFQSVLKTAVAFYLFKNGSRDQVFDAIKELENSTGANRVWYFDPGTEVIQSHGDEILHNVVIRGDHREKCLYAFVEFFSIHKFLVQLSDQYTGEDFFEQYSFDPVTQKDHSHKPAHFRLFKGKIDKVFRNKDFPRERVVRDYSRVLEIIYRPLSTESLVSAAIDKVFNKYPEGTLITSEICAELAHEVATALMPRIAQASRQRRKETEV